jgi:MerR family mercuric resistance operon transcriptional regulator
MVRTQARTIGALASAAGVGVETVRYYQRRGLLATPERMGEPGHGSPPRHYGEGDIQRLRFIRAAQAAGFTLREIGELIALDAGEDRARVRALAERRIAALDAKIVEMKRARDALSRLAQDCGAASTGPCPIIVAFEHG